MDQAAKIEQLKNGIRRHAPIVADYFDRHDRLIDYAPALSEVTLDATQRVRQQALCRQIGLVQWRLFGHPPTVTPPLAINIADHHAWLNHPIMVATNIVANAHRMLAGETAVPIVVLTSSIVPPNNFFNRKGFLLHGKKVPLFSNREMHQASCFIPRHDFRFTQRLQAIGAWVAFTPDEQTFLARLEAAVTALDLSRAQNYNDQISLINHWLWQQLFHPKLRAMVPKLEYVTQEEVVGGALPSVLSADTIVTRVLFDRQVRDDVLRTFRGLTGCWDETRHKGTHFFWYRTDRNEPGQLWCTGDKLVAKDGAISIPLQPQEIAAAVQRQVLVPSLFLIFGYLTFWCGLRPLVGYGSGNYLTRMKEAWLNVLRRHMPEEVERVSQINTQGLIGGVAVAFRRSERGTIDTQYAADVMYSGGMRREYLDRLLSMRLSDLLGPALTEIYESYVPIDEREDLGLTPADLMGKSLDWIR